MNKNVGTADRIIRTIVGLSIIGAGIYFSSWWGTLGGLIMIPAILGSDPVYDWIGINTNKKN
ncbi:MAG: DUF2892 domain-containing protein [Flavobacteriales bacterium]|nr:DUF2892 domain-containing protein [Flavobacteriales bacterium]